jgi:hypothetical protein
MSIDENNFEIDLDPGDKLRNEGIIQRFVKNIKHNYLKIELNHKYEKSNVIVSTANIKDWSKFHESLRKMLNLKGVYDQEHIRLILNAVDENHERIIENNDNFGNNQKQYSTTALQYHYNREQGEQEDQSSKEKREIPIYKYSQLGKGSLHEAVIVNGLPFFVRYDHDTQTFELVEKIEENSRILRPPNVEEYPYTPYEFESNDEIHFFIQKAKEITLAHLYRKCKSIFLKFVDQDKYIINLLAVDTIWTYFQDLFSVTHYLEGVGDNDVGKSTIGYTFEFTGYRVVKGVAISGANYNRVLGSIEPGQCVIIEDEGESISEDPDKVKILKSGYEYNGKVPKINMNSKDQDQRWFKTYGYKMILAEKSLNQLKAKGLVDRTFSFHCRPGKVKYSIKEVVSQNINKTPKLQRLYNELISFRKLMLCYRLVNYKRQDLLPKIETGLKNRDNELCKPLLQLFYNNNSSNVVRGGEEEKTLYQEIIKTLEVFLKQRKERKSNSLEAAIFPIIKQILIDQDKVNELDQVHNTKVKYSKIWNKITKGQSTETEKEGFVIKGELEGLYDPKKPNQYETTDYGILYINYLSTFISNKFGATLDKKKDGSTLDFDIEKLKLFENIYGDNQLEKDIKIQVKLMAEEEDQEEDDNEDDKLEDDEI